MSGFTDNKARDAAILALQVENKSLRTTLQQMAQDLAALKAGRRSSAASTSSSRRPSLGSRVSSVEDWSARITAMDRQDAGKAVNVVGLVMIPTTYTDYDDLFGVPVTEQGAPEPMIRVRSGGLIHSTHRDLRASDFSLPEDVQSVKKALTAFQQYSRGDKAKAERMSAAFRQRHPTILLLGDTEDAMAKLGPKRAVAK